MWLLLILALRSPMPHLALLIFEQQWSVTTTLTFRFPDKPTACGKWKNAERQKSGIEDPAILVDPAGRQLVPDLRRRSL